MSGLFEKLYLRKVLKKELLPEGDQPPSRTRKARREYQKKRRQNAKRLVNSM